ncbi:hypothetical protein ANRL4_01076 [Anaerolineae bacterium]|nr:hypothetical protein ANRL4_01076 [Anaerolineae bacterium]
MVDFQIRSYSSIITRLGKEVIVRRFFTRKRLIVNILWGILIVFILLFILVVYLYRHIDPVPFGFLTIFSDHLPHLR